MERENLRFQGLDWYSRDNAPVVVVGGAGGIGSWLAFFLARANFNVTLSDFDTVEKHNIGGQLFKRSQIGKYKAEAVGRNVSEFSANTINAQIVKITEETATHEFMFSAFDNMDARRAMFKVWKRSWNSMNRPIFIDGRLNAEQFQIFCVTPQNADEYERMHLFNDSEVEDAPCSAQQTTHTAAMIAGHMVGFFTNHITNINLRDEVREIPFMYEYFTPMNLTVSE
ncbi:MAG TPA: ThiF family adenylyltransferase [Candidatus Dojkabacteria bacterium]|nr:ThiF family adenylyltransferase [Candidatus Dojkabacteria bacterium]